MKRPILGEDWLAVISGFLMIAVVLGGVPQHNSFPRRLRQSLNAARPRPFRRNPAGAPRV